jgi:hypothetical protein
VSKEDSRFSTAGHIVLAVANNEQTCLRASCESYLVQDLHCGDVEIIIQQESGINEWNQRFLCLLNGTSMAVARPRSCIFG